MEKPTNLTTGSRDSLTEELKYYLDKVGDPSSPFVLGKLKEGYS